MRHAQASHRRFRRAAIAVGLTGGVLGFGGVESADAHPLYCSFQSGAYIPVTEYAATSIWISLYDPHLSVCYTTPESALGGSVTVGWDWRGSIESGPSDVFVSCTRSGTVNNYCYWSLREPGNPTVGPVDP